MTKAIRRLTDIKFEHEGAHVALVGKHQGGPANGITTLVTKATNHISQTMIEKASEVTVTLQFPEFLRKFFGMYWEDSEVLSSALGFGRTEYPEYNDDRDYINDKVKTINVMKSVYKSQDVEAALAALAPDQMLALLVDQEMLEKAMSSALPLGESLSDKPSNAEEDDMEKIEKSLHEELITKAVSEAQAVAKAAFDAQELVLKAAQDQVATYQAAEALAVQKARKEALAKAVPAEQVEELQKSLEPLSAEAFDRVIASYAVMKAAEDGNDMFQEKGVPGQLETDVEQIDATTAILKAKHAPKA